jgi:hypothetical protein
MDLSARPVPRRDPEADWKQALANRRREIAAMRDRVRSDIHIDPDKRRGPLRIIVPTALQQPLTTTGSYIKAHVPWERGVLAIQDIFQSPFDSRWSPLDCDRIKEEDESSEEGFLDENCEPFVFE